ncbi:MAG TPA: hypothetical protein P5096_03715 [Patescibacteria group bacterium]|nr:hypothetical protein [Patescibacteria group bacterium]
MKRLRKVALLPMILMIAILAGAVFAGGCAKTQKVSKNPTVVTKDAGTGTAKDASKLLKDVVPKGNIIKCEELVDKGLVQTCTMVCAPGGKVAQRLVAQKAKPDMIRKMIANCPNDYKARIVDPCISKEGKDIEHLTCVYTALTEFGIEVVDDKLGVPSEDVPNVFDALRENKADHKEIKSGIKDIKKDTAETVKIVRETKPVIIKTGKQVNDIHKIVTSPSFATNTKPTVGSVPPAGKKKKASAGNTANDLDNQARALYNAGDWNALCKMIGRLIELDPNNTWYKSLGSYCNSLAAKPKKNKRDTIIGATMGTLGDMYIDKPLCDMSLKKSMHGRKCVLNPAGLFFDYLLWDATVNIMPKKIQDNVFGKNRPVPPPPPASNPNPNPTPGNGNGGAGQYCEKCGNVADTTNVSGITPDVPNSQVWDSDWQPAPGTTGGAGTSTSVIGANAWPEPSPRSNPTSAVKTSGFEDSGKTNISNVASVGVVPPPPPPPPAAESNSSLF